MRNIREVKVGDIVVASGIEHLVLGVAGELFGYSTSFGKYFYGWMSFEQAEELGWHIKEEKVDGVDDSEEAREHNRLLELSAKRIEEGTKIMREALNKVTLTEDEIISLLNVTEEQLRDPHFMASRITQEQWKTLKSKLNKMLKEKE